MPLFLGAGFCLGAMDALAKLTIPLLGMFAVVWARYVSQAIVVAAWAWRRGGPGFWRTRHPALQLGRSTLLLTATGCFYAALRYLPLAEASAISFVSPVVVVLLAPWLLGERTRRSQLVAAAAGFAGVLIVLRPGGSVFHPAALLLFGTAACVALYVLLTRKVPHDAPHTTLFYSSVAGVVVLTPLAPWFAGGDVWTPANALRLGLLGLLGGLGHGFVTVAYLRAPAAMLAPYTYVQVLWATGWGWIFFGQLPDAVSFAGMAVIVASGVALAWQERRRALAIATVP